MKHKIFGTTYNIFLSLVFIVCSLFAFPTEARGETQWRQHPAFFRDVAQIIDTPQRCYMVLHGEYYDKKIAGFNNPVLSLFSWDSNQPDSLPEPVQGIGSDLHFVQYHPGAGCLIIVYFSGAIDLLYDDGRLEPITGYADVSLPYDRLLTSITIDPVRPKAYLAASWGWLVVDLERGVLQRRALTRKPVEWVAAVGNNTYIVSDSNLFYLPGLPEEVSAEASLIPVKAFFDEESSDRAVTDVERLLPLPDALALLRATNVGGTSSLSLLVNVDNGNECYSIGELTLSLIAANSAPALRDMAAVGVTSGSYVFDTSDMLRCFDWSQRPAFADYSSRTAALDAFRTSALKSIRKPVSGAMAASGAENRMVQYILPVGLGESGFSLYNINNGVAALQRSGVRPLAPVAGVTDNMTWHPRYGVIIANHGNSVHFTETGVQTPSRLSLYSDNVWTPYMYYLDPPAFSTETAHRSRWNTYKDRFPVTSPRGLVVDPDNDRFLYTGSWFYGMARYDLDDRSSAPLRMAQPSGVGYLLPGFAPIAPRQTGGNYYMCTFTNPSFDADGTLWSAYWNIGANSTGDGFQLWYWTRDDRAAAAQAADDPSSVTGWNHLTVPELRFHGNGRMLALRHPSNRNLLVAYSNNYDAPLVIYDHNGTLDDTSDDRIVSHPTLTSPMVGGMVNKARIYCIAENPVTGDVWIGTDSGCFIMQPRSMFTSTQVSLPYVQSVIGKEEDGSPLELCGVSAIDFDSDGNTWIGTSGNGLFCLSADGSQLLHRYSADLSPLPNDFIYSLCWNPDHNSVMISTAQGMTECYVDGLLDNDPRKQVMATPSHVRADYFGYVTFSGIPEGTRVAISDSEGNIIRAFSETDTTLQWDLLDNDGRRPVTGLYRLVDPETSAVLVTITLTSI